LRFGIRLAWFREDGLAVNFMSNGAENDRVGRFAFFERTFGPFNLVLSVVMTAAFDLFDAKIDLKKLARGAQDAQTLRQDFRPDAVTGQSYD
jgi:hypothetical protein